MKKITLEKLTAFCKENGIVFAGSDIYDGLANSWDFGPIGVELLNNIKKAWWKRFVQVSENSFGLDAAILMNPKVWEASGHVESFADAMVDCKFCKARHRADHLIEAHSKGKIDGDTLTNEQMDKYIVGNKVACPRCGKSDFTKVRNFNNMFSTSRGVTEENQNIIYLRPETAQGEFVNFLNVQRSMRAKVPFGIAQIGKAFRNEITPGNFIFRTIEFEQMEHQLFCRAEDGLKFYEDYKARAFEFLTDLGIDKNNLRFKDHSKLSHYAKAACDVQYNFPMGWSELNGVHHRGDWDLSRHQQFSKKSMLYTDPNTNEKFLPNVIEYSIGANRLVMCVLCDAYFEEEVDGEIRAVLRLNPAIAPYKAAVLPLIKKIHGEKAREVLGVLNKTFMCSVDEGGSIGKRYRRQDEVGTPFCITVDDQSLVDGTFTLRNRDDMKQERLTLSEIENKISAAIKF